MSTEEEGVGGLTLIYIARLLANHGKILSKILLDRIPALLSNPSVDF